MKYKKLLHGAIVCTILTAIILLLKSTVAFAYTPQSLYDEVWKLVYSKISRSG